VVESRPLGFPNPAYIARSGEMIALIQEEWEKLSKSEKRRQLFLTQKQTLCSFLEHGAISQAQFDKSFGDLMDKMGYDENGNPCPVK